MPDISMCRGVGCPIKEKCWRYTAPPSMRQSMSSLEDICLPENTYEMFICNCCEGSACLCRTEGNGDNPVPDGT